MYGKNTGYKKFIFVFHKNFFFTGLELMASKKSLGQKCQKN